jgi:hypothetical protein
MAAENRKYVLVQIIISFLTLILTPVFSGLVINHQLSTQHQFWGKQREVIKSDDLETKKSQLLADLSTIHSRYINSLLNYHLSNIKLIILQARQKLAEDTKILFFDTIVKLRPSAEEYQQIDKQLLQNMNDYLGEVRQLRSCLVSVSMTYSDDLASQITAVENSIEFVVPDVNQVNELILQYQKVLRQLERTKDVTQYNRSLNEFMNTYFSAYLVEGNEKLNSSMKLLLASMRTECDIH